MIASLSGIILSAGMETAIIDVHGVGYEVAGTSRFLSNLVAGEQILCSIDTMVREDFIRLYAFSSDAERQCFRLLQSVQGVGAKAALAILQVLTPADLLDAVAVEDATSVARAHGVGKKIATRIVTELQGKMPDLPVAQLQVSPLTAAGGAEGDTAQTSRDMSTEERTHQRDNTQGAIGSGGGISSHEVTIRADAVSALVNLGYDAHHARQAVKIASDAAPDATVQALIRLSLKSLAMA